MERGKNLYLWVFLTVVLCGLSLAETARAETVKIGGTGFGLGVMKILGQTFEKSHPGEKIEVIPSLGSAGGIKALLHGALNIAISGRPLKPAESGEGIEAKAFTRSPFIFIVNKSVAQKGITLQELEKIFSGEMLAWPGGARIRPVLRPDTDTVTKVVRSLSSGMDQAITLATSREGMILAITDQDSARIVEKTPGALAAGTLTQMYSERRQVGILSFNGTVPSVKALRDGVYPLSIPLYLVTPENIGKTSRKFLAFLHSSEGSKILTENGNLVVGTPDNGAP